MALATTPTVDLDDAERTLVETVETKQQVAPPVEVPMPAVTPDSMRDVMGAFASGVTVVTGADDDGPVGFTCQSFSSVSLDPPLVLFCADHRGSTWPRIQASGLFCVNVLAEGQIDECFAFGSRTGTKFEEVEWRESDRGLPMIEDVIARIHCEVETVHVAGDHDVVIGRVFALEHVDQTRPMVFYRGGFTLDAPTD